MIVFLLIGSGEIQPWAINRGKQQRTTPEQEPLSGIEE